MDLAAIARIKQRLLDGEDYAEVSGDLLLLFGAVDYGKMGELCAAPYLTALLREITREACGVEVRVDEFASIPEVQLLHGGIRLSGFAGAVFYFADIGIGLLLVLSPDGVSTRFCRFEARAGLPPGFN